MLLRVERHRKSPNRLIFRQRSLLLIFFALNFMSSFPSSLPPLLSAIFLSAGVFMLDHKPTEAKIPPWLSEEILFVCMSLGSFRPFSFGTPTPPPMDPKPKNIKRSIPLSSTNENLQTDVLQLLTTVITSLRQPIIVHQKGKMAT